MSTSDNPAPDHGSVPPATSIHPSSGLRLFTIAGALLFLGFSLIYGPGRGLSLASAGEVGLGIHISLTYALIAAAALTLPRLPRSAVVVLLLGVVSRCHLELRISLLGEWFRSYGSAGESMNWIATMILSYGLNFIAPALLLLESLDLWRQRRTAATPK